MKIAIAADHRGFRLKEEIIFFLSDAHIFPRLDLEDLGTWNGTDPVDYPDYAEAVALAVARGSAERGILICGSGVGVSVAANKIPGARAAVCHDLYSAHQGVEHDAMNILVLGARIVTGAQARELVRTFLAAKFDEIPRHIRRIHKISSIERNMCADLGRPKREAS
jgi:RpiB/LacA/LacB family sugar-phosphate isomerase